MYEELEGDGYYYSADVTAYNIPKYKTFFPSNMPPEVVIETIMEAYKNFKGTPVLQKNGYFKIDSFTNEGVKIRIILKENKSDARIVTAFPVFG
ncbi:MAG: EndoU domain-containing protein [Candidatus Babeliales bacterium]